MTLEVPAILAAVTTVGDMDAARALAQAIVERKLAACVQLSAIESFYRWDGAVQHAPEVRLVFKTTEAAWPALHQAIVALHPYSLPEVHAHHLDQVHMPYAHWVAEQIAEGAAARSDKKDLLDEGIRKGNAKVDR